MNKTLSKVSVKELAALVGSKLKEHKIDAVLTGGAAVTIYSENRYLSTDLDFVTLAAEYQGKTIKAAMAELGFQLKTEGFFEHPDCPFIIEFIPPPLAVGQEPVKAVRTIRVKHGSFRILSPTDCVKDRLAAYYHWHDPQSLEQAVMVAKSCRVSQKEIKRWSKVEGKSEQYKDFLARLEND